MVNYESTSHKMDVSGSTTSADASVDGNRNTFSVSGHVQEPVYSLLMDDGTFMVNEIVIICRIDRCPERLVDVMSLKRFLQSVTSIWLLPIQCCE